jgi:hypothetical protein
MGEACSTHVGDGIFIQIFVEDIDLGVDSTTANPLRSRWNIGPQQLSVAEVSVAFKIYRHRVASPVLQPQTWRTRSPYLYPLETG